METDVVNKIHSTGPDHVLAENMGKAHLAYADIALSNQITG